MFPPRHPGKKLKNMENLSDSINSIPVNLLSFSRLVGWTYTLLLHFVVFNEISSHLGLFEWELFLNLFMKELFKTLFHGYFCLAYMSSSRRVVGCLSVFWSVGLSVCLYMFINSNIYNRLLVPLDKIQKIQNYEQNKYGKKYRKCKTQKYKIQEI